MRYLAAAARRLEALGRPRLRRFGALDAEAQRALERLALANMREVNPAARPRDFARSLRHRYSYVLYAGAGAAGCDGFVAFRPLLEGGKRTLYVYECQVAPGARRRGVGARLLAEAGELAAALGLDVLALTCLKANAGALAFYAAQGFAPAPQSPGPGDAEDYYILEKAVD